MSFLEGLGAVAGGLDQTLGPAIQQYQQNTATGQGIAAMYGGLPQQQGGGSSSLQGLLGGGSSPLQSLLGGSSAPPNVSVQAPATPQLGLGGVAQSPVTPPTLPTAAPALPSSQPMTANAGARGVTPPSLQPPPQQPQPPPQQPQPPPQNQPAALPDLSQHNGMFDFHTLMSNLIKTPGMNYEKLGRIANSRAFENMLNQQGLNQYRMLNLGLGQERVGVSEDRLKQQADEFGKREERLQGKEVNMTQQHALDRQEMQIERAYSQATQKLLFGPGDEASKKAAQAEADKAYKEGLDRVNKQRDDLDKKMQGGEESSGGKDSSALEEAQAAIKAGAPRDKVIERFKQKHPDLDASSLGQ